MTKAARAPKTYTIRVTTYRTYGEDKVREVSGTLEYLTSYFGYTLEIGHSWDNRINPKPKTIRGLISAVQKSSDIKYGRTYTREYFELV